MKLGATLYIKNTVEAVAFYTEAFGLTLGYHEKFPDGTFMHAALLRDGQEIFAVSESHNDAFVDMMLASSLKASRPTMSYGIHFDSEDEVKRAYDRNFVRMIPYLETDRSQNPRRICDVKRTSICT